MTRIPARVLVASAALLVSAACAPGMPSAKQPARSGSPTARPSPAALTQAQARAALVTAADLGAPWAPTQGAATWRDGVLKATSDRPDCRRLLDALYTDDLFGTDTPTRAVTGLDDALDEAQLRYQVLTLGASDVNRTLAWMGTLPRTCGTFTAVTDHGAVQGGQVQGTDLPKLGDARQGLRVSLTGETADGEQTVLTLDVAVVRVGGDTIALTHGGPGDVSADATAAALRTGVDRLARIRKQVRAQV